MVTQVTYGEEKTGIDDYIESFLLSSFEGEKMHVRKDFLNILRKSDRKVHIHFDYKLSLLLWYMLLLPILNMEGKDTVTTMHSYIIPGNTEKAFRIYLSGRPFLRILKKLGMVDLGVRTVNRTIKKYSDRVLVHKQCEKNDRSLDKVVHPVHTESQGREDKKVLFLGRITPNKGFELLVDTAERMPETSFVAVYSYISDDRKIRKARKKAEKLENFDMLEKVTERFLNQMIEYSDCICLPYRGAEGFSNALGKAVDHRKVTVTTDTGVFRDISFTLKADSDPENLKEKIQEALNLGREQKEDIKKKMEEYQKDHSLEEFIEEHRQIYREL